MKQKHFLIFIVLAVVFASISAFLITNTIQERKPVTKIEEPVEIEGPVEVVVATKNIHPYAPIFEFVTTQELPEGAVPEDAITDPEKLKGKYSKGLLLSDDIIREGHLLGKGTDNVVVSKLSAFELPELRAVPVSIPAGFEGIKADNLVNILLTTGEKTKLFLENVRVLDVDLETEMFFLLLSEADVKDYFAAKTKGELHFTYSPIHKDIVPREINIQEENDLSEQNEFSGFKAEMDDKFYVLESIWWEDENLHLKWKVGHNFQEETPLNTVFNLFGKEKNISLSREITNEVMLLPDSEEVLFTTFPFSDPQSVEQGQWVITIECMDTKRTYEHLLSQIEE